MARSRLEKIGTIYSRSSALLNSGAMAWEERPLWYDLYEAFPPKDEPRFDRPTPNMTLKNIFYEEDKIRAMFQKNKQIGTINMFSTKKTPTQQFIENYKKLEAQNPDSSPKQLYKEAVELFNKSRTKDEQDIHSEGSLSSAFKKAHFKSEEPVKINVSDLFKE